MNRAATSLGQRAKAEMFAAVGTLATVPIRGLFKVGY
jgi:hypothetical protein